MTARDDQPQPDPRRREFLRGAARFLMLGGLGAYFIQQRQRAALLANDPSCIKLNTCSDCIEFSGCSLPKSHTHREEQAARLK
jgi:hypothetical protein